MVPGATLLAVACTPGILCVAGDDQQHVVTSTDPARGAGTWSVSSAPAALAAISCPSLTLCVGTDGTSVVVSTDPPGGGGTWRVVTQGSSSGNAIMEGASCPSTSLCVVGDEAGTVATSTDPAGGPGAWQSTTLDSGTTDNPGGPVPNSVACPTPSFCAVVDGSDMVFTSTDPTGGAGAWKATDLSNVVPDDGHGNDIAGLSCPSTQLCITATTDLRGGLVVSTDPAAGARSWRLLALRGFHPVTGISCPTPSFCATGASNGYVYLSSDPTGGPRAWQPVHIDGHNTVEAISCVTPRLCVAVDEAGNVLVGQAKR